MDKEKFTSRRTDSYKKLLEKLPVEIQQACQQTFEDWKRNPSSLKMKALAALNNEGFSAEINLRYRALGFKQKDSEGKTDYVWFWVGSHEDYNNIIANRAITNKIKQMRNNLKNNSIENKHKI